jgi:hypothetical protein
MYSLGEKYDPYTDSVFLSAEEDDRHQVLATYQQQLNNLIKAAKVLYRLKSLKY